MEDFLKILFGGLSVGHILGLIFYAYMGILVLYAVRKAYNKEDINFHWKSYKTLMDILLVFVYVRFSNELLNTLSLNLFAEKEMTEAFTSFIFGLFIDIASSRINRLIKSKKEEEMSKTIVFDLIENLNQDVIVSIDNVGINMTAAALEQSNPSSYNIVVGADQKTYLIRVNVQVQSHIVLRRSNGTLYDFTTVDFVGQRPVGR